MSCCKENPATIISSPHEVLIYDTLNVYAGLVMIYDINAGCVDFYPQDI